jgi:hypothetical protein
MGQAAFIEAERELITGGRREIRDPVSQRQESRNPASSSLPLRALKVS